MPASTLAGVITAVGTVFTAVALIAALNRNGIEVPVDQSVDPGTTTT